MERDITSITSENIFPDGKMEQNSTGDAIPSLLLSPSNGDEKVQSRYLKPSMASCHDYCKYGKKHDSEATNPNLKAFLKKKFRERQQEQVAPVEERKMRTVIKAKMETESRSESGSSDKSDFSKTKSPSPLKKNITPGEKKTLLTSGVIKQNQVKNLNQDHEKKTKVIKSWIPRQPKSSPDKHNLINIPSAKEGASGYPAIIKEDSESIVSEPISSIAPKEIKSPGSEAGGSGYPVIVKEDSESTVSEPISSIAPKEIKSPGSEGGSGYPVIIKEYSESTVSEPISSIAPKEIKSPGSEEGDSGNHGIMKENTKSFVSELTTPATPEVMNQKTPPSAKKPQKIKQKTPLPRKNVDVAARSAIVLKTKTPLIRSLSRRKSSRSLIAQSIQAKKITQSIGTSRFEGVASKPANTLKSKAPLLRSISKLKSSIGQFARRNQEKFTKNPSLSEIGEDTASPADTLKTETPAVRSVSQLKPSWSPSARRNRESKINKSLNTSNIAERKLLKAPPASFDSVSSLKPRKLNSLNRTTSLKSKDKVGRTNSKKKSDNTVSDRCYNYKNADSESATNNLNSVEIEGNSKVEVSKGQDKRGARRSSTARPEDNISAPYRLKFRQGKVIDLRSDSIGARRLWFRMGKMAAEDPNSSSLAWRRSFKKKKDMGSLDSNLPNSEAQIVVLKHQDVGKKKEAQAFFVGKKAGENSNGSLSYRRSFKKKKDMGISELLTGKKAGEKPNSSILSWRRSFKKKKDMGSSVSNVPNSEAQTVVLKHQDVGKKEAQALFNHVIEATASKLVGTRKSKVMALVGAFETVISLQESKPASAV